MYNFPVLSQKIRVKVHRVDLAYRERTNRQKQVLIVPRMSWIEGVGDEVTIAATIIAVLSIILVAWVSTGIRDIPFIRVVVVQLTRRRRQAEETVESHEDDLLVQHPDNATEAEPDPVAEPVTQGVESDAAEGPVDRTDSNTNIAETEANDEAETETNNKNEDSIDEEDVAPSTVENLSATELRQRRLEFYKDSSSTDGRNQVTDQTLESKNSVDEKSVKDRSSSNGKSKEAEIKSPHQKSLSDLASSLLSTELENSRRGRTESRQSEGESENQPRGSGNQSSETVDEIRVRLKYLNDTQRLVKASPSDTIGNFRRKHFTAELSESKLIRFIFNGQDLRNDNSTLQACNIIDNSVVHCLITQQREQQGQSVNHQDEGLFDIGIFMFPLFGILLGIVWYLRFMYRQFFNVTSTLTLGGITFLYVAAFMSSLRANRPHQHLE